MTKQEEYASAMSRYHQGAFYKRLALTISVLVIAMQAICLIQVPWTDQLVSAQGLVCFLLAYAITDFVNGFVHMWMDNNEDYSSRIGPLVAIFHLHHKVPRYQSRHPLAIYFFESGSKNWLVVYLGVVIWAQLSLSLPEPLSFMLASIGVLSSFAELSHYWCHNSQHVFVRGLQRCGILLSPRHHGIHHAQDNVHYAFLNGMSDPVLNLIAKHGFAGYKGRTDSHAARYQGDNNANRVLR